MTYQPSSTGRDTAAPDAAIDLRDRLRTAGVERGADTRRSDDRSSNARINAWRRRAGSIVLASLTAGLWWRFGYLVPLAVLALAAMVVVHETGHFLMARRVGMLVTEFSFGFGPLLASWTRGETQYSIRLVPLGGFVKVPGMDRTDNRHDPAVEPRTFRSATTGRKVAMLAAGAGMQLLVAMGAFTAANLLDGIPDAGRWMVHTVAAGSPAAEIGLVPGDRITAVEGIVVGSSSDLFDAVRARPDQLVTLSVTDTDGISRRTSVTLGTSGSPAVGFLGVSAAPGVRHLGVVSSASAAVRDAGRGLGATVGAIVRVLSPSGLGHLVGSTADQISAKGGGAAATTPTPVDRPVSMIGITSLMGRSIDLGLGTFLLMWGWINLSIGVFNLFPVPPLDGGHIMVALYERLRSSRGTRHLVDPRPIKVVAVMVVSLLLGVEVLAGILDVLRPLV